MKKIDIDVIETVSFQIHYTDKAMKTKFKNWAYENRLSMKELLYSLIDSKEQIRKEKVFQAMVVRNTKKY